MIGHDAPMKITEVRVYGHSITVADGRYQMSLSEVDALDCTVVKCADAGLVGYGETTPGPTYQGSMPPEPGPPSPRLPA